MHQISPFSKSKIKKKFVETQSPPQTPYPPPHFLFYNSIIDRACRA